MATFSYRKALDFAMFHRSWDAQFKASARAYPRHIGLPRTVPQHRRRPGRRKPYGKAYIRFYNHHRLHSGIDYHTPEEYERLVP